MNRKEELTRQFRALRGELNAITQAEDAAHNAKVQAAAPQAQVACNDGLAGND